MLLEPIGILHTPHRSLANIPIQPAGAADIHGTAEVYAAWAAGLADLDGFSHAILIYEFHLVRDKRLSVVPFLDDRPRGIFATRAPTRPNPLGLSVVQILEVVDGTLRFVGADMLDGTPLLDIKPWLPEFRAPGEVRRGWLEGKVTAADKTRSDDRFIH
ncbi:MAG: tRNA (N6-threonylcarbamoyladenosine(37)-N6)-methyltransferase TrmO [Candidatus Cloacimonetes bacterium]|nr:tRNA (N6-threonylcarbamoyladenosine(37)-N6)-methyltransferase TrmO [Candidatus Cloacimonadota bacterium]